MKPAPMLLVAASLAANAVLLVVVARPPPAPDEVRASGLPSDVDAATAADTAPGKARAADRTVTITSDPAHPAPKWFDLAGADLASLVRQLTDAGFPRPAIVAIVGEMRAEKERALQRQFSRDDAALPYWRAANYARNSAYDEARLARRKEAAAELRAALGPGWQVADDSELARLQRTYGVSDPAKLAALVAINEDYSQVGMEVANEDRASGTSNDLRRESQEMINREQLADIMALLTPEEFAEYEVRAGPTARALRNTLRHFQASEAEYRALFAAYQSTGDTTPGRFNSRQLVDAAHTVLPPERLADLQQAVAPGAQRLNQFATRFNLPLSAVAPVQAAQRDATTRANEIRRDTTLTDAQRQTQLAALAADATQKVSAALGEKTFPAYREYDGAWITGLTSPDDGRRP